MLQELKQIFSYICQRNQDIEKIEMSISKNNVMDLYFYKNNETIIFGALSIEVFCSIIEMNRYLHDTKVRYEQDILYSMLHFINKNTYNEFISNLLSFIFMLRHKFNIITYEFIIKFDQNTQNCTYFLPSFCNTKTFNQNSNFNLYITEQDIDHFEEFVLDEKHIVSD